MKKLDDSVRDIFFFNSSASIIFLMASYKSD